MKKMIRRLSEAVEEVLNQNSIANEFNAAVDYGEWSQSAPDFSDLVSKWKLTREQLLEYCRLAEEYSNKWFEMYPKEAKAKLSYFQYGSFEYRNVWFVRLQNLHCIFMSGELND